MLDNEEKIYVNYAYFHFPQKKSFGIIWIRKRTIYFYCSEGILTVEILILKYINGKEQYVARVWHNNKCITSQIKVPIKCDVNKKQLF